MAQKGSQKGISLPINMVVILAVAVLVLVVVAAYFVISAGRGFGAITTEQAWVNGCQKLKQVENCLASAGSIVIKDYNPANKEDLKNTGDTLLTACKTKFADSTFADTTCKQSCGCA